MVDWLVLTRYHTISTFNDPVQEAFWKHCGKRRTYWLPAFSPFPTFFSIRPKTNFNLSVTVILSSAYAFNLDQSRILSFDKNLDRFQINFCRIATVSAPVHIVLSLALLVLRNSFIQKH